MASLAPLVAISLDGLPTPQLLSRWREVARPRATYRPLPALMEIVDDAGYPTPAYQSLFNGVMGVALDPRRPVSDYAGLPTHDHMEDWGKIV